MLSHNTMTQRDCQSSSPHPTASPVPRWSLVLPVISDPGCLHLLQRRAQALPSALPSGCAEGLGRPAPGAPCLPCAEGTWGADGACRKCPAGTWSQRRGAANASTCRTEARGSGGGGQMLDGPSL